MRLGGDRRLIFRILHQKWECRVGINAGTVIGSIVGVQKYVYDIFGPGVNLAARMETLSDTMQKTLCEDMYELIKNDFRLEERGSQNLKGFGSEQIYTLLGTHEPLYMGI